MSNPSSVEQHRWSRRIMWCLTSVFGLLILAALLIPNFIRTDCVGPLSRCNSNLKNIGTALGMYAMDHDSQYPRNLDLLKPNYLRTIPKCPESERQTYRASFGPRAPGNLQGDENFYFYECTGGNHTHLDMPPNYPRYDSINGLTERSDSLQKLDFPPCNYFLDFRIMEQIGAHPGQGIGQTENLSKYQKMQRRLRARFSPKTNDLGKGK